MQAYGVFEGGGARGYAHVGALRALEKRGIEFRAVAGTSIGAAIAALVAAGYTGPELFHQNGNGEHRGLLSEDLESQLLRSAEYGRIKRWRGRWRWVRSVTARLSKYPTYRWVIDRLAVSAKSVRRRILSRLYFTWWLLVVPFVVVICPLIFAVHGRLFREVWATSGATGTDVFRMWLNERLRVKLNLPENTVVKFRHFQRIRLRVVAADLSRGAIRVFGGTDCDEMEVAEAVSASISFPLFFRPVRIGSSIFVDGGMVSNFPAWVLDDLRAQEPNSFPTFGFRLGTDQSKQVQDWPGEVSPRVFELAVRLVNAALYSRQSLESRQIDDYHPIILPTHIRTLDFDLLKSERARLVAMGESGVEQYFAQHIGPRAPDEMERALRGYANLAKDVTLSTGIVRAYLIQRIDEHFCRVVYSAFFEGEADDRLLIRWETSSQTLCLRMREPILMRVANIPKADRLQPSTKYLHAARPQYVHHVYCVPIFGKPEDWSLIDPNAREAPIAALCVDFDENADYGLLLDPLVEDFMAVLAQAAGEYWLGRVLTQLLEPNPVPSPSPDWREIAGARGYYRSDRKPRSPLKGEVAESLDELIRRIGVN